MTATIYQSECFAYDTSTVYSVVTLSTEETGTITYEIGSADTNTSSITWEGITLNNALTLSNPNKALFLKATGDVGGTLSEVRIIYS